MITTEIQRKQTLLCLLTLGFFCFFSVYLLTYLFSLIGADFAGLQAWYKKAYEKKTEIAENSIGGYTLLCNQTYFTMYLTWMNFFVRFVIPTAILIVCNIKIYREVSGLSS